MDEEEEEIINPFEEVDFEEGLGPQSDDFDPNFDVLDVVEAIGTQNPEYDFYSAEGEAPGTIDNYDVAFLQAGEPSLAAQEIMGGYEAPELSSIVPERLQGVWSLTEALGTVNPDLNVFGDDLITAEDIRAFDRGIPFARDYYGGYGVSPDEIEESETYGQTYAGYVPTEGIDSLQYLFGPQNIPPGLEKTFFDVERDPFRQDWSEGAFVPYYYDLGEMSEVDQDLYRNSESFLSDLGERASASGFDDINLYLMSLSSEDPVEFSRQRDLYNYFAPIYEELGPRYRAIQQESFQESLRSPEMRDYLQTPEGSRDIVQSIGILAAASGIDPSRLTSQDVSALLDIIGTGGLDSLISGNETTGPRFSVVSSDDGGSTTTVSQKIVDQNGNDIIRVEDGQLIDAVTNETLELDPITGTIDILDENGNKAGTVSLGEDGSIEIDEVSGPDPSNTVFDDPPGQTTGGPGPDQQYQATPGFDRGDISYFYDVNDFSEGYEFLRFVSPDGFRYNPDADIEGGEYGVSFGDFSLRSGADEVRQYDQIYGNNPIMGYNPDDAPIDWSELDTLPGESSQIISGFASETATINGGKSEDSVSLVQYPAFLVSAVNDNEPSLMRVSGGDPYAWWESLSTSDRLKFESAYSGSGEEVVYVDVEDPTADIFNRDESGKITEYLMPMWMVKKQLVSKNFGDEVDHKMWSHLSASARNELQEKAASDSQTITGEDLKLVPVMRVSDDGTIETATFNYGTSSEDDAVIIFPDPQQKSTSVRIEPNIDKLTFGQFAKVVADSGFDNTFVDHADYMSEATKELVRNDLGDNRAWESFHNTGRNPYHARNNFEAKAPSGDFARNTTYKGSRNSGTSANRNDWPNFNSPWHGTAFPDGLFDYVINNIDNFRDATGGDVYAVPIRASGDPDIEIGSVQDWTPGGSSGHPRRRTFYSERFEQIDIDGEKILSGIDNETSSQYRNVKTLGDIKNVDPIDWGVFLAGAGDAEEDDLTDSQRAARDGGWEGIYNTDWIPFGKEDVDEYGNDIQYYPIKDPASDVGGVYFGIEEWMLQVGRMYQAYSNAIDNRPASTLNEKEFYENIIGQKQKTYESPDRLSFDEIENMDERKRLQKQWSEEADSAWISKLISAEGANSGDNFSDLFGGFEAPYPLFVPADFETESLYSGGIVGVSGSPGHTGDFEFSGGGYVPGVQGGMDDTVPAVTDGSSFAKLSSGEFVIPADVVSGLGDGNNANGAQKLYEMMDRIRSFKTGSPVQPPPIDESMVLPE